MDLELTRWHSRGYRHAEHANPYGTISSERVLATGPHRRSHRTRHQPAVSTSPSYPGQPRAQGLPSTSPASTCSNTPRQERLHWRLPPPFWQHNRARMEGRTHPGPPAELTHRHSSALFVVSAVALPVPLPTELGAYVSICPQLSHLMRSPSSGQSWFQAYQHF